MNKIINSLKYWGQLFLLPIYWLSFLMPRDKHIWLFGSTFGNRFADNPRYLYLYVAQHSSYASDKVKDSVEQWERGGKGWHEDNNCKGIRAIWISRNKEIITFLNDNGYEAYYYHSLMGIWYALRGKVYFFDNYSKDINFWQSGGAVKVNLWHGIPLKKIQHDNIFDKFRHPANAWEAWKNFPRNISDEKPGHYILCPSRNMRDIYASAFRTENVIECGYPRWDGIVSDTFMDVYDEHERLLYNEITSWKETGHEVIFYAPTFRDSEEMVYQALPIKELNDILKKSKKVLFIKNHVKSKYSDILHKRAEGLSNVIILNKNLDAMELLLKECDVLITDYSSAYFDYLLTERPIIFFVPDYEEYLAQSRELYFKYNDVTPGYKVKNGKDILSVIEGDKWEDSQMYNSVRKQFIEEGSYDYSCAMVKEILKIID